MIAPRIDNMVPFKLVVYANGLTIADVSRTLRITTTQVRELVARLAGDLLGLPATVAPRGNTRVMDAGATVIGIRTTAGRQAVSADALSELHDAYPAGLYDAQDLLSSRADTVMRQGADYTADRIRLFAQPAGQDGGTAGVWPHGMAVPQTEDRYGVQYVDLAGPSAATVIGAVRADPINWVALRSPSGEVLRLSWRYLLPHE
jgi:hypothetical protein